MALIKSLLHAFVVWWKYRNIVFQRVGKGSNYRALSSVFLYAKNISIGNNVQIGPRAYLDGAGGIELGDGCIIAPEVKIYSRSHNFDDNVQALPFDNVMLVAPVKVGRYVWVGANAIVLPGVEIGDGAVIGAGSVVSKSIPACAVAVGNPAVVKKYRDRAVFDGLMAEANPFVYEKLGHGKVFKKSQ